jgi:hypothetical protein
MAIVKKEKTKQLVLTTRSRYSSLKLNRLFEKGVVYTLPEAAADDLLELTDSNDVPYFRVATKKDQAGAAGKVVVAAPAAPSLPADEEDEDGEDEDEDGGETGGEGGSEGSTTPPADDTATDL